MAKSDWDYYDPKTGKKGNLKEKAKKAQQEAVAKIAREKMKAIRKSSEDEGQKSGILRMMSERYEDMESGEEKDRLKKKIEKAKEAFWGE